MGSCAAPFPRAARPSFSYRLPGSFLQSRGGSLLPRAEDQAIRANNNGRSGQRTGAVQDRLTKFFDTSVFSQPAAFTFGNLGPRLPDVRNEGMFNWDLSAFKNFHATERINV